MCHEEWKANTDEGGKTAEFHVHVDDIALMQVFWYESPAGAKSSTPCVLVSDIYGTVPFYHEISKRLALLGYSTALPDLFCREGALSEVTREAAFARRSRMDECQAIVDTHRVIDRVKALTGARKVGVVGFCLGGMIMFDVCAERNDVVGVSFYGFPEGISMPVRVPAPRPIDRVDLISGPILAMWGDQDPNIPVDVIERFGLAMDANAADYEAHIYPGAGHGFLQGLVEERPDSGVALQAWQRTIEFLDAHSDGRVESG